MILADAAVTTGLDPTAQVLLTVFGAALVTAAAGFVGAALQGRREHNRWVREQRFVAYQKALALIDRATLVHEAHDDDHGEPTVSESNQLDRLVEERIEMSAILMLVGPLAVVTQFRTALTAVYSPDDHERLTELGILHVQMHRALDIKT